MNDAERLCRDPAMRWVVGDRAITGSAAMRTLAMPKAVEPWSLTSLREKLIKIGAKVVSHGRYVTFHMWTAPSSQGVCSALIRSLASICPACLYARTGTLAKMVSATRAPNKWATS